MCNVDDGLKWMVWVNSRFLDDAMIVNRLALRATNSTMMVQSSEIKLFDHLNHGRRCLTGH